MGDSEKPRRSFQLTIVERISYANIRSFDGPALQYLSKITFLTPDQRKILTGSCRQLIFGCAKTGRTTMLKCKALQLLSQNQSVFVLATNDSADQYKKLFNSYRFDNYKVLSWKEQDRDLFFHLYEWLGAKGGGYDQDDFIASVYDYVQCYSVHELKEVIEWLLVYDHILIDDAGGKIKLNILEAPIAYLILMALASYLWPKKTVWVAMDFLFDHFMSDHRYRFIIMKLVQNSNTFSELSSCLQYYSVAILGQSAVSSDDKNRYELMIRSLPEWLPALRCALGITYSDRRRIFLHELNASSILNARELLAKEISTELQRLHRANVRFEDIIVISYDHTRKSDALNKYLLKHVSGGRKVNISFQKLHSNGKTCRLYTRGTWDGDRSSLLRTGQMIYAICLPHSEREYLNRQLLVWDMSNTFYNLIFIIAMYNEESLAAPVGELLDKKGTDFNCRCCDNKIGK